MTKECTICGKDFETLSEKRKTCNTACAEELVKRKRNAASYDYVPRECTFNLLEKQYHGQLID